MYEPRNGWPREMDHGREVRLSYPPEAKIAPAFSLSQPIAKDGPDKSDLASLAHCSFV